MSIFKRMRRKLFYSLFLISLLTLLTTSYLKYSNHHQQKQKKVTTEQQNPTLDTQQACKHPELDLWDPSIRKHFKDTPPLECSEELDWICLEKGVAKFCDYNATSHKSAQCNFTFLKRVSDQKIPKNDYNVVNVSWNEPLALVSDFFRVKCSDKDNNATWSNIMAAIRNDSNIHKRAGWQHLPSNSMGLNVLIWGFDSLSRLTFMRKLPNTYKYLTKELNALVLKDYNIVGDGTPQALIPIFTGKTELELPETKRRMGSKATFVNIYPFV